MACHLAQRAFVGGAELLRAGLKETEVAAMFRAPLSTEEANGQSAVRADGFIFCMAGENSAQAYGAYAHSSAKALAPGDFVLAHCNSYVDGYWTDITRTYCIGDADERKQEMYHAVLAARQAAINIIFPGVKAADVDAAARDVLKAHGFARKFKHPTGHGVGFTAIDHHARPRLHPKSDDVLEAGMILNVEPAIYIEGYGGLRHCDMAAVTAGVPEILTPFQYGMESLIITRSPSVVQVPLL